MPYTVIPEAPPGTSGNDATVAGMVNTIPGMPYVAGAANYAANLGEPGSFDQGYNKYEQYGQSLNDVYPNRYAIGTGIGTGLEIAAGGPALIRGAMTAGPALARGAVAAAKMAPEVGLRAGGAGLRWGAAPYYAAHFMEPAGAGTLWGMGKYWQGLANAMRDTRLGNSATAGRLAAEGNAERATQGTGELARILKSIFGGR